MQWVRGLKPWDVHSPFSLDLIATGFPLNGWSSTIRVRNEMPDYKLYRICPAGQIQSRDDYAASDDLEALARAQQICGSHEIEIWDGARFVARVAADGSASHIAPQGPYARPTIGEP